MHCRTFINLGLELPELQLMAPWLLQIDNATDLDDQLDDILANQMERHPHQLLHTVAFY